ncbi:hypothetical protein Tco_1188755, partial [Tanacetum coccineum]
ENSDPHSDWLQVVIKCKSANEGIMCNLMKAVFVFDYGFWVKMLGPLETSAHLREEQQQMVNGAVTDLKSAITVLWDFDSPELDTVDKGKTNRPGVVKEELEESVVVDERVQVVSGEVGPRHAPNYSMVNAILEKEDGLGRDALEGNSATAGTPTSAGGAGIRFEFPFSDSTNELRLLIILLLVSNRSIRFAEGLLSSWLLNWKFEFGFSLGSRI